MEKLQADIQGKVKHLKFTLGKTDEVLEPNSALAINRHRDALNTLVGRIDQLKLQVLEELFRIAKLRRSSLLGPQALKSRSPKLIRRSHI